jgi:hypothetical protein
MKTEKNLMIQEKTTSIKNHQWRHAKHVAWRKVEDEAVILDMDTAVYYSLQETGARIWELIGQGKSVQEIIQIIVEEYDAAEQEVRKDVDEIILKLKKEKIIEPA